MPIAELRVKNFRAFKDSGPIKIGGITPIVGKNDVGKSALLRALQLFFEPPKKGGLGLDDIHNKDPGLIAEIEVAFYPSALETQEVQIDAKNKIHLTNDCLVDGQGLLRLRLSVSSREVSAFEILVKDVDEDAFFPLATKNHDELLKLLEENKLPAIKAGKETNQEKRNKLREHAQKAGIGFREAYVNAADIEKKLRDVLPQLILFTDTANYGIGETPVQNQFKGIVDRAIASNPSAKQIEEQIQAALQEEFNKVYERLSRLTSGVTSLEASAKVSWKKAVDGISLSWGDPAGISISYELRGAGVRRLFMVAYFQYEAAASLYSTQGPKYIFAVEEPEVHLHPGAQRELDLAFRELADLGHTVIFTTHAPVFASTISLNDLVLVIRPHAAAEVQQKPDIDAIQVASELGVEASDRLIGKNHVILVEGPKDVGFYTNVLELLYEAGHTTLDPKSVLFLQCGGIDSLAFTVNMRCIDEAGLKWAVLADSDREAESLPISQKAQTLQNLCPPSCAKLNFLNRSNIENYLDAGAVKSITGIDCIIPHYGKPTDLAGNLLSKGKLNKIKTKGPEIVKEMGADSIHVCSQDDSGNSEFVDIFEGIKQAFEL